MSLKVLYSSSKVLFWDILVIITLSKLDPTLSRMKITLMSKLDLITMDPERGEIAPKKQIRSSYCWVHKKVRGASTIDMIEICT